MKRTLLLLLPVVAIAAPAAAVTTCTFTNDAATSTMTLDADCTTDESIVIPDGWTLQGAGRSITAIGAFVGAIVTNGGDTANVRNLTVRALGLPCNCHSGDQRLRGIYLNGASGSITDNVVEDINQGACGCQEGNAIEVRNAPFDGTHPGTVVAEIARNVARDYQKNGITAIGDVAIVVVDNEVSGNGQVDFIAQNGIQLGYGTRGTVEDNVVDGNWYTGSNWAATGILVFESNGVKVKDNVIRENQVGLTAEAWGFFAPSADGNHFSGNDILENEYGVVVDALTGGYGYSNMDSSASDNKVTANRILNDLVDGEIGIYVGAYFFYDGESTGFTPTARNNQLHGNRIRGFAEGIVIDGATGTKSTGNRIE